TTPVTRVRVADTPEPGTRPSVTSTTAPAPAASAALVKSAGANPNAPLNPRTTSRLGKISSSFMRIPWRIPGPAGKTMVAGSRQLGNAPRQPLEAWRERFVRFRARRPACLAGKPGTPARPTAVEVIWLRESENAPVENSDDCRMPGGRCRRVRVDRLCGRSGGFLSGVWRDRHRQHGRPDDHRRRDRGGG